MLDAILKALPPSPGAQHSVLVYVKRLVVKPVECDMFLWFCHVYLVL